MLSEIKNDYKLEMLHNTIQAWIEYTPWTQYPEHWSTVTQLAEEAHKNGLKVGSTFGFHTSEFFEAHIDDPYGFLYYYKTLPENEKWKFPNGTIADDPYYVGSSRSFSGKLVWRKDMYSVMQPQNPYWVKFLIEWGKKNIDCRVDGIFLDSIDGSFPMFWHGGWGNNQTWEGYMFIKFLKERHSSNELETWGVNLNNFSLNEYLKNKYNLIGVYGTEYLVRGFYESSWLEQAIFENPEEIMQDPVVKEYILYQYTTLQNFIRNITNALKTYAESLNKTILLTANEYETWNPETYDIHGITGILLIPYFDVAYVERSSFNIPPYQKDVAVYKAAIAATQYSKPVWVSEWTLYFSNPFSPNPPPTNISSLLKIKIAEGYATGGIRLIPFGTGLPEYWPPQRLVNGLERDEVAKYYNFINDHKEIFLNVRSNASVALIYSLPTVIWQYFPTLGLYPKVYKAELGGWAAVLEELHIPYDIIIFGLSPFFNDTCNSNQLKKYSVIIAPQLSRISQKQLETLENYITSGGKLIITPPFAQFDEMNNPQTSSIIENVLNNSNTVIIEESLGYQYQESLEKRNPNAQILNEISEILSKLLPQKQITTNAPKEVYVNPLIQFDEQGKLQRIIIHLVNYKYSYNSEKDWTTPIKNIKIRINLPFSNNITVYVISPDETIKYTYNVENGQLTININKLNIWNIIIIEPGKVTIPPAKKKPITQTIIIAAAVIIIITTIPILKRKIKHKS